MNETMTMTNRGTHADVHAGSTEGTGGEYYRAYYRELVARGASRTERSRRLEAIKMERSRVRREKWLKGIKSLASVLISSEALS
jgi:hypothetical protein